MANINNVSETWERDKIIVEYLTTELSLYAGLLIKSDKKVSPYILVSCNAAPNNMEKKKNNAILYSLKREKAFNPNFSVHVACGSIKFCGGHLGNVNENIPKAKAITDAM